MTTLGDNRKSGPKLTGGTRPSYEMAYLSPPARGALPPRRRRRVRSGDRLLAAGLVLVVIALTALWIVALA